MSKPDYVYVASSWRNPVYPGVVAALAAAGIEHYDFRNPPNGAGFGWEQIGGTPYSRLEPMLDYLTMIEHPRAVEGFTADFEAMQRADTVVLVLPCGKSAHLELGWAVGAGKRTAILLEDPVEPELMYRAVDYLAPSLHDLLGWLTLGGRVVEAQIFDGQQGNMQRDYERNRAQGRDQVESAARAIVGLT